MGRVLLFCSRSRWLKKTTIPKPEAPLAIFFKQFYTQNSYALYEIKE